MLIPIKKQKRMIGLDVSLSSSFHAFRTLRSRTYAEYWPSLLYAGFVTARQSL